MDCKIIFKAIGNEYGAKAACTLAQSATVVLTNPVTVGGAVILGLGYMGYKHLENSDKRKYGYAK